MPKYLMEIKSTATGDTALHQVQAASSEEAITKIEDGWQLIRVRHTWGGTRKGAGRVSKWGDGVITERYRLPVNFGSNAEEIVSSIETLKTVLEVWELKVQESCSRSNGLPSERYKYVKQMVQELKQCLQSLPDDLV